MLFISSLHNKRTKRPYKTPHSFTIPIWGKRSLNVCSYISTRENRYLNVLRKRSPYKHILYFHIEFHWLILHTIGHDEGRTLESGTCYVNSGYFFYTF